MQRTDVSEDPGDLLRRYRIEAGLTQEALAERADVGLRSIQGIERGERTPHRDTLRRLVEALHLSAEQRRRVEALIRGPPRPPRDGPARLTVLAPRSAAVKRATRARLPASLTSFVGRQGELAEVKRLLATCRLVTLTGPPGVGKTRLALEVAAIVAPELADGAAFVPLSAIRDPDLVLPALAQAVGIEGFERQPLVERLVETLRDRHALLVLDNFEQVATAAREIAELLAGCPRLAVLATSRQRLRIRGEHEVVVPPLPVPDLAASATPPGRPADETGRCDAETLFVDRARAVRPDLIVDDANARAIAEICRRLDGLPLAIELAAARCKIVPPPVLLARLQDRFALLGDGAVDLPPRQKTLREAIAWSHDLLDDGERALFRRLAVFVDGFTLSAAEAVCAGRLDAVGSLVDKSLVQADAASTSHRAGERRFRMLETIRDFARGQLAASGDETALRVRHAAYYLALAEHDESDRPAPTAGSVLTAPLPDEGGLAAQAESGASRPSGVWLDRLEADHGNLQAVLRFLIDQRDGERAARLANALAPYWVARGYVDEARAWLGEILALVGDSDRTLTRADLLLLAGRLAFKHSDNALARRRVEDSLGIYRGLGDRRRIATALWAAGLIARWQGQYDVAWQRFEEQRSIWQELGDALGLAESDDVQGVVAFWMGDAARGRALLERALAEMRRLGDREMEGYILYNLGFVAHGQGDCPTALACYEKRLAIARELGAPMNVGEVLGSLGDLALDRGDPEAARTYLAESLVIHRDLGNRREIAHVLECFAGLAALQDQPERAIRLSAAAAALRETIGEPIPPDQAIRLERRLGRLCLASGDETFDRARADGKVLNLAEAVAEALGERDT